ncbi:MAG: hypothetical protein KME31_33130 [Tolypothrix carrinoi HA7290-LM1]|nr:hypothetical protein [Tolypothrix carrinoi HA7290-LM1]
MLYARNKAEYEKNKPSREEGGSPRKLPKVAYGYKPMAIAAGDTAKKYKVQGSKEGVTFFTATALNLLSGDAVAALDPLPRGAKPAKVHAMVADSTPTVIKAEGSKRPYIRYGKGTRGSNAQYTYTAPISIQTASAIDTEIKTAFTAVKGKLGGAYGRVWYEPEYFVISDGGE